MRRCGRCILITGSCGTSVNRCPLLCSIDTPTKSVIPEREVICVSLKKDPKFGVGEYTVNSIESCVCIYTLKGHVLD